MMINYLFKYYKYYTRHKIKLVNIINDKYYMNQYYILKSSQYKGGIIWIQ